MITARWGSRPVTWWLRDRTQVILLSSSTSISTLHIGLYVRRWIDNSTTAASADNWQRPEILGGIVANRKSVEGSGPAGRHESDSDTVTQCIKLTLVSAFVTVTYNLQWVFCMSICEENASVFLHLYLALDAYFTLRFFSWSLSYSRTVLASTVRLVPCYLTTLTVVTE